jgi:hypothetical protein
VGEEVKRAIALLGLLLLGSGGQAASPGLVVEEIPNPAAPGGGEAQLSALADGRAVLSWIEPAGAGHAVRLAVREGGRFGEARTIASKANLVVNWADFPAVAGLADGTLFAHWLERSGPDKYAYGVKVARSRDLGRTWSEGLVPHTDQSPVEHGFVSMAEDPEGRMAIVWLDGRAKTATALFSARLGAEGTAAAEEQVDGRVCDCCQTALVRTRLGLLAAFRGRSEGEVRDIAIARHQQGAWTRSEVVAADLWKIDGCPVNGPALAVDGDRVALAWFTMAPSARMRLAVSSDAGLHWDPPIDLQEGRPMGRVDVAFLQGGDVLVSFLEQAKPAAESGKSGEAASAGATRLVLRRVGRDGRLGALVEAAPASPARTSGFPRLERAGRDVLLAWRDTGGPPRIRTAVVRSAQP